MEMQEVRRSPNSAPVAQLNIPAKSLAGGAWNSLPGANSKHRRAPRLCRRVRSGGGAGHRHRHRRPGGNGLRPRSRAGRGTGAACIARATASLLPRVLHEEKPQYTSMRCARKSAGHRLLECVVRPDGNVATWQVIARSTRHSAHSAAMAARAVALRPRPRARRTRALLIKIERRLPCGRRAGELKT